MSASTTHSGYHDDDLRLFRLSVDVRSFKAGKRLPMKAVNAFVKVLLPREIVKLALAVPNPGNAAKLAAPLRTHPPVMVEKGSEVPISNGYVALELPASVRGLAAALAKDPRLQAQVFHRDKYAADSLIGWASIPMAHLVNEPWLDGYAPVHSDSVTAEENDQAMVGALRVVLSAEELGPVTVPNKRCRRPSEGGKGGNATTIQLPGLEDTFILLKKNFQSQLGSRAIAIQTDLQNCSEKEPGDRIFRNKSRKVEIVQEEVKGKEKSAKRGPETSLKTDIGANSGKDQFTREMEDDIRKRPEYDLAWEFEMWRRSEEAKWRADLKERESRRMAALEAEWKYREKERVAQMDKIRTELLSLENKLRAKLLVLEKRERALVLAEETASLRREALTRDYAQRASDAEVAVKRLQAECEHRVELERMKYASLKEQHTLLEKRLANANEALNKLEMQFVAYRTEHQRTSEAELTGQISLLKQQRDDFQRRTELAIQARNHYKAQVLKLVKDLCNLRQEHAREVVNRDAQERQEQYAAASQHVEKETRKRSEERLEIKQLKEQLDRLHMHEQTTMAAATAAAAAAAAAAIVSRQVPESCMKDERLENFNSVSDTVPAVVSHQVLMSRKDKVIENPENARGAIAAVVSRQVPESENDSRVAEDRPPPAAAAAALCTNKNNIALAAVQRDSNEVAQVDLDTRGESRMLENMLSVQGLEEDSFDEWLTGEAFQADDLSPKTNMDRTPFLEIGQTAQSETSVPAIKKLLEQIKQWNLKVGVKDEDENIKVLDHEPSSPSLHLSAFQKTEIERLRKQRTELLQTGVYKEDDRIIEGLDQEIERLESVDTKRLTFI